MNVGLLRSGDSEGTSFRFNCWKKKQVNMQGKYLCFFVIGLLAPTTLTKHVQFYRHDYVFMKQSGAFYKLHWSSAGNAWTTAFKTCQMEGTSLFYVSTPQEVEIPKMLIKDFFTQPPNVTDVFIGTHDEFKLGEFVTVDGNTAPNISVPKNAHDELLMGEKRCNLMDINTGTFRVGECHKEGTPAMFVCKKIDESCPTIDTGYAYVKEIKKCYKVNTTPLTWLGAMQTCYMEGGLLANIEYSYDAVGLKKLIDDDVAYFIGFRKMFDSSDFYTVKGEIYNNDYFRAWNERQNQNDYDCGILTRSNNNNNNDYNDRSRIQIKARNCEETLPFICEMEVA